MKVKLDLGRTSDDIVHHQLVDVQFNRLLGDKGRLRTHSWLRFTAATTKIICQTQLWTHTHIYILVVCFHLDHPFWNLPYLTSPKPGMEEIIILGSRMIWHFTWYFILKETVFLNLKDLYMLYTISDEIFSTRSKWNIDLLDNNVNVFYSTRFFKRV